MSITVNVNDDTSLDACKGHTTLDVGGNTAAKISPTSENFDIEVNNYYATEIEEP